MVLSSSAWSTLNSTLTSGRRPGSRFTGELLQQRAERVALVVEGIQQLRARIADDGRERLVGIDVETQRQQVHAMADEPRLVGHGLSGGRQSDDHGSGAGDAMQQRGERAGESGRQAGAEFRAPLADVGGERGIERDVGAARAEAAPGAARAIGRQIERRAPIAQSG